MPLTDHEIDILANKAAGLAELFTDRELLQLLDRARTQKHSPEHSVLVEYIGAIVGFCMQNHMTVTSTLHRIEKERKARVMFATAAEYVKAVLIEARDAAEKGQEKRSKK